MRTKYIFIIVIACLWGCRGTKNVVADKTDSNTNKVDENLAKSNANPDGLETQSEYLPQDKPFLDSLKRHLLKLDAGGWENEYIYMDSIPPILKKVFPNVIFFKSITWITSDAKPLYMAYYDKRSYLLISNFNILYKDVVKQVNNENLNEKATAYLHLALGYMSQIDILSLKSCDVKLPVSNITCNYAADVNFLNKQSTFLFYIKRNQILAVFEKKGEKFKSFNSSYEAPE